MKKIYALLVIIILISGCKNTEVSISNDITESKDMAIAPEDDYYKDRIHEDETKVLSKEIPEDFEFVFSYGFSQADYHDSIDTINKIITKDLILDGVGKASFDFDSEFIEVIYKILYEGNIARYPDKFEPPYKDNSEPDIEVTCTPNMVYNIYILANGEEYEIYWNNKNCSETINALNLEKRLNEIIILVKRLDEYKGLGEPNGEYL